MHLKRMTKHLLALVMALCMVVTLLPVPARAAGGSSMETATPVQPGVSFSAEGRNGDGYRYFSFTTTKPGQYVYWTVTGTGTNLGDSAGYIYVTDGNGSSLRGTSFYNGKTYSNYACTGTPGTYYFQINFYGSTQQSCEVTFELLDNDSNEPNNSYTDATPLTSGQTVDVSVADCDTDWFTVTTTEDGQDIALTFSGFAHDNQGYFYLNFDNGNDSYTVQRNGTLYFHAAKAGVHAIKLYHHNSAPLSVFMTADILADDTNEPNDSADSATALLMGTDGFFRLGGYGDEDWFTFEAAVPPGENQQLYTLNLLDLNPDYSDTLRYDVYAPDGTAVITGASVNIRHSNVLACTQTGLYKVRLYNGSMTRSLLRIRVEEGGADPYEANDVWTEAAAVSVGAPVQFILASTADTDWFKFEVPEADMTLLYTIDRTTRLYIYDGETLQEQGASNCLREHYGTDPNYTYRYKFTHPGVYYLRLSSDGNYISQELRTLNLTLLPATEEEHNDSYLTALPLFDGVPQSYTTSADNDRDWFRIEVPAGVKQLVVNCGVSELDGMIGEGGAYLYSARDFEYIGNNAPALTSGNPLVLNTPTPGTYYVRVYNNNNYGRESTVVYHLFYDTLVGGNDRNTAVPLPLGQWFTTAGHTNNYSAYYSLGALKAGDELRVYTENIGSLSLYSSNGSSIAAPSLSSDPYWVLLIPADDTYTIAFNLNYRYLDAQGQPRLGRILVDVGNTSAATFTVEGLPTSLTLEVGQTYRLVPRLAPYNGDFDAKQTNSIFSFSSGNSNILSTNSNYSSVFTAKAPGTTTITVKPYSSTYSHLNFSYTIPVTVVAPGSLTPATALTITNAPADMTVGEKVDLILAKQPVDANEAVSWSSSDSKVLYVNAFGSVTAVGPGTAIITAETASGVSAQAQITVGPAPDKVPVSSVTLNDYDLTLYAGEAPTQLVATVNPANADYSGIIWTSSNVSAATVDQQGNVTPVAAGIAVITASAGDYKASCIVTVHAPRVRVESITFEQSTMELPMGGKTTLVPIITPSDATVQNVTWLSSDESIAVVSRTGIVTALAVGTVTITATSVDNPELVATVTITVTATARLGDINMDSYIDSADALLTLRYAVGAITLTAEELERADVNGDGYVDAGDAIRILRYDAGLIDRF